MTQQSSATMYTIAIDAMGGDHGTKVTVRAALEAGKKYPDIKLVLVGCEQTIRAELETQHASLTEKLVLHPASEVVGMDESPTKALRIKKDSSMRVAINLVKENLANACVSAGNTGALMATAHYVLKTLSGIDRPAIVSPFPTEDHNKCVNVLDLGANATASAENLYQFAVMGAVLSQARNNIARPKVGLLNIGVEQIKGNDLVKSADELLAKSNCFDYVGYIEGDDIFKGVVDVVVCDGFVGNIVLKSLEGLAKLIVHYTKLSFRQNLWNKISALLARPALRSAWREIDPSRRNGASLIGLKGIVVKSHGGANVFAFANAIEEAILEVKANVLGTISSEVSRHLTQELNID